MSAVQIFMVYINRRSVIGFFLLLDVMDFVFGTWLGRLLSGVLAGQ